jgi:hypothetical protein
MRTKPMRIEPRNGTNIVCGHIFPDKAIKAGQTWQGSGGVRVQVTGTRITPAGDTWVEYMQSNGVAHEKMAFAFQSRYGIDIGDAETLPPDLLEHVSSWEAMHIGYAYKIGEFLYDFQQHPGGVHVNRYKVGAAGYAAPSYVQALNCKLEFVSILELEMVTRMSFQNIQIARKTIAGLNEDMMKTMAQKVLEENGWKSLDLNTAAIGSRDYQTAAGGRTAVAFLSKGDGFNRTLSADYQSEGRNATAGDSILLPLDADIKAVRELAQKFAVGVERTVQQTYAMKLMHNRFPAEEVVEPEPALPDAPTSA